jgi:hypothetical protein
MTRMNIDALKANLTNPQRSYLWDVMFVNPIGGGDSEALSLRCQSTSVPGFNFGSILIPFKQTPGMKVPGKLNMTHTWVCTFVEGTDKKVFDAIYAWRQAMQSDVSGIGSPDILIKSDIYLLMVDAPGAMTTQIRLIGGYPEMMDDTPLSYDDESVVKYSVTWSYDIWTRKN